jgi:hypothetical protein
MNPYRSVAIRRLSHLHQHSERSALRTGDRHPSRTGRLAPHSSGRHRRDDTASRYSWSGHSQLTRRQLPPRRQGPRGPHSRHGHPLVGATRRAPRRQRERRKRRLTATPLPGSWRPQAGHDSHDFDATSQHRDTALTGVTPRRSGSHTAGRDRHVGTPTWRPPHGHSQYRPAGSHHPSRPASVTPALADTRGHRPR